MLCSELFWEDDAVYNPQRSPERPQLQSLFWLFSFNKPDVKISKSVSVCYIKNYNIKLFLTSEEAKTVSGCLVFSTLLGVC